MCYIEILTLSGSCDLFSETGDDSAGGIVLVQGVRQLLSGRLQLLAQREAVKHHGILRRKKKQTTLRMNTHLL